MPEHLTVLVTGATDGLGKALAHRLAGRGHHVLLHGRSQDKLDQTKAELQQGNPAAPEPATFRADLSDGEQVTALATAVLATTGRLDVLVNNAGVGGGRDGKRTVTAAGHELVLAVNFLAPFALTLRLLPLLRTTGQARVVHVASGAQQPVDPRDLMLEKGYSDSRAYGQSKFALIATGFALAARLDPAEVTVNSLHPGTLMPTKMVLSRSRSTVDTLETGIDSVDRLVTDPALRAVSGRYFDRRREAEASPTAYDPRVQQWLWDKALDLTGAPEPE
ncbi:short chain dehydrogenase [Amycolatopsis sacchari]|uniref:Short chain dehydrogenase n=1 Tax=Amycolatopsis sacchari TaxID=115433 RepID=A0A1I3RGQ2_9PSEU|nr:SDR family NAD(P)-dependent oxidoreductase [Amycolatopsis sacchari]SFJ44899.1 short chain dehydrogenase [Amycolatopsis sacchari]